MSKKVDHRGDMILLYALLTIITLLLVFPLVYAVGGSFKSTEKLLLGNPKILPETWRPENYMKVWKQANFVGHTLNSVFFIVASVIGTIITSSMTGYTISRCDFPGKKLPTDIFGFMMFLIGAVILFPIFQPCRKLGLLDSIRGVVITQTATAQPFYCILVTGHCNGISKEIGGAAIINGVSLFKIYTTILIPIMKSILAVTGILAFRGTWNNHMVPLVSILSRLELYPLTVGAVLLKNRGDDVVVRSIMLAGTVVFIVPILIVYLFLNRYFVEGITAGAVKG